MFGFSSTFTLAILTLPCISAAISSSAGPIMRQGPHHSAQKSTTTGSADFSTSWSKLVSVTFMVAIASPWARSGGLVRRSAVVRRGLPGGQGEAAMRSRGREAIERPVELFGAQFLDRGFGGPDKERPDPPPEVDLLKEEPIERK